MATLPLFTAKTSSSPINAELAVFCSPHDLIAIVSADQDVVVYRLNGQIAFTVKCKEPGELNVTAVAWKPDGSLLAIGWSDGSFGVHEGGTGRVVSEGRIGGGSNTEEKWRLDLEPGWGGDDDEEGRVGVAGFGWERHQVGHGKNTPGDLLGDEGWDDEDDGGTAERLADLPRAIATLDIAKVLPRLSFIPSHGLRAGPEGNRFGTQAATDGVFGTKREDVADAVDVLLVYTEAGDVRVLLDEAVPIGNLSVASKPLRHASHGHGSTHALISQSTDETLQLHFQALPLSNLGGPLLHVVARDTKRITTTLAYVTQTIRCITHDYSTGLQFPTRLINSINLTFCEASPPEGNLVYNFSHLAMTGHFTPNMLEWLTDIVKEPNHKRWDQAIGNMYAHIQSHLFINLLPALDRMSVAVCSLRGHAILQKDTTTFDVTPQLLSNILEGIDALRLVANKALVVCVHEWQLFRAFSKWLRVMIDIGIAGPGTKTTFELEEKEAASIDYSLVLQYIKDIMMGSQLAVYVTRLDEMKGAFGREDFFEHAVIRPQSYENTKDALTRIAEKKASVADLPLLNLQAITVSLTGRVRVAMDRIAHWQSKTLPPLETPYNCLDLLPADSSICDMRMLTPGANGEAAIRFLGLASYNIFLTGPISRITRDQSQPFFPLESSSECQDAKFISDTACICLRRCLYSDADSEIVRVDFASGVSSAEESVLHSFMPDEAFTPQRLLVGGRKRKEVLFVFGDEGRSWKAFDLSGKQTTIDANENGVGANDSMQF